MKNLLTITAFLEAVTGVTLLAIPSLVGSLLLGASLTEASGIIVGRISGVALTSLAFACWLSKNNAQASVVMVRALMLYNISVALILSYAALVEHLAGVGLWPAVLLHALLFVWCVQSLRIKR